MHLRLGSDCLKALSQAEVERIFKSSLEVLEKNGVKVDNREMLKMFSDFGCSVDYSKSILYFSKQTIIEHINRVKKTDWDSLDINFSATAEFYEGYYLDPFDDKLKRWSTDILESTVKVVRALDSLDGISMLGCPLIDTPINLQPLYEKLYCWKYGIKGGHAIWSTEMCPHIYKMYETYALSQNKSINDIFLATVYMISPLMLGHVEAEQFMYFYDRGLKVNVGNNAALGGGLPVTLAGGLVIQLAECIFISILNRVFFNEMELHLGASISVMDMRTASQQYGRPEKNLANIAMSQIAKWLRVSSSGHCGLSDAKTPGYEAGAQKTASAIFNALSCGHGYIAAGLLGTDEIFSPIQLIIDHDLLKSLQYTSQGVTVDENTLAFETILEEGHGNAFIGTEHTAKNHLCALWQPATWSNNMLKMWNTTDCRIDIDKAQNIFMKIVNDNKPIQYLIDEELENKLMNIIKACKS